MTQPPPTNAEMVAECNRAARLLEAYFNPRPRAAKILNAAATALATIPALEAEVGRLRGVLRSVEDAMAIEGLFGTKVTPAEVIHIRAVLSAALEPPQ